MTEQEFERLMKMNKRDLVKEIWRLQNCVTQLEKHNTDMSWRLNPDRMGGQFTEEEKNRSGWL